MDAESRLLAEKDAEIERLKLELHQEKKYAADLTTTLRCEAQEKLETEIAARDLAYRENTDLRKIITELADALRKCKSSGWEYRSDFNGVQLIQRAREARPTGQWPS